MAKIQITQNRDFEFTAFLKDKNGNATPIVGQTLVKVKMKNADGTTLELVAPQVAKVNEVQTLAFSEDPSSGTFKLDFGNGNITANINFNDSLATVETKINALNIFSAVVVTGVIDQATGLTLTFGGNDGGREQPLPIVTNALLPTLIVTPAETVKGVALSGVLVVSEERGEIKVNGSEVQSALLEEANNQTAVFIVRIADKDLNIPPQISFHDVLADPLT